MKTQTRLESTIEIMVSMVIGYILAMGVYMVVTPIYGHAPTWGESFEVVAIFTAVSFARGYLVRRLFNHIQQRGLQWRRKK